MCTLRTSTYALTTIIVIHSFASMDFLSTQMILFASFILKCSSLQKIPWGKWILIFAILSSYETTKWRSYKTINQKLLLNINWEGKRRKRRKRNEKQYGKKHNVQKQTRKKKKKTFWNHYYRILPHHTTSPLLQTDESDLFFSFFFFFFLYYFACCFVIICALQ